MDLLGFAFMSNHFHLILRSRPDATATWSDEEVARRWLMLCPHRRKSPSSKGRRFCHESESAGNQFHCRVPDQTCRNPQAIEQFHLVDDGDRSAPKVSYDGFPAWKGHSCGQSAHDSSVAKQENAYIRFTRFHNKLCTSNPELVNAYAVAAIEYFQHSPEATCYSLSPSDSAGDCECDACSALYEIDPNGKRSVTPAILEFYNNVARIVAAQYPDKILAGYVYADYLFPPRESVKLEPNVFVVLAPSIDYGFTLARPSVRKQWRKLLADWTQVTKNISYYDLPVNITTEAGALYPSGLDILKFIYSKLASSQVKGV